MSTDHLGKPKCWQDVPPGTIAWGASAQAVETGLWRSMRPVLDTGKCVSCLMCWVQCPDTSIVTDENGAVTGVNLFFCKGCGVCAAVCPVNAISMHPEADFVGASEEKRGENPGSVGEFIGS